MGRRDYLIAPQTSPIVVFPQPDGSTTPSDIFLALTRQLSEHFEINRGVLVLRDPGAESFSAVSTWHNGNTRDGLSIRLPSESSLFEHVAEDGRVYTEDFCGSFSGNFFERKLLIDDSSRSFVLQPIKFEGEVIGLLGFSSEESIAFSLFEEGAMDEITAEFAQIVHRAEFEDDQSTGTK